MLRMFQIILFIYFFIYSFAIENGKVNVLKILSFSFSYLFHLEGVRKFGSFVFRQVCNQIN